MNLLEELYKNDIYSEELLKKNEYYNIARSEYERAYQKLRELLSDDESVLDELLFSICEMEYQCGKTMFTTGFSMGKRYVEIVNQA